MTFPETLEAIDADNRTRRWKVYGAGLFLLVALLVGGWIDGGNHRDQAHADTLPCVVTP